MQTRKKNTMTDIEKIQATLVTLLEAAQVGGLQFERAEAIHHELMNRISKQGDAVELIATRLVELVNTK